MAKTALVTGASDGIGRALAVALAGDGFEVTAVARTESKLKELVSRLGVSHRYIVADLSSDTGQDLIVRELTSRHYNLLVNNAGMGSVGKFVDSSLDRQLKVIKVNCETVAKLAYAFLSKAEKGDALINTSSTSAFMPMPTIGLYCATKAFVSAFSETLWYEQKDRGVYVMGLCPGPTDTNFQVVSGGRKEDIPKNITQQPEEVALAALKALKARKKPTVITGAKNVVLASMGRFMTRKSAVSMMGKMVGASKAT